MSERGPEEREFAAEPRQMVDKHGAQHAECPDCRAAGCVPVADGESVAAQMGVDPELQEAVTEMFKTADPFVSHSRDLLNRFSYHPPQGNQQDRYVEIRAKGLEFATLISVETPASAEQTLAIRKIEEAVMWANAAIARNE